MGLVSDAELIRCWQRGDASAFAELVRRWQQPVARFLHRAGSADSIQELCQEVFLRVHRSASAYRGDGAFSTWLYRIAINAARDAGRRLRVRKDQHSPESASHVEALIPDHRHPIPEQACERRELATTITTLLGELPDEQRLVLVLRHYEGVSFEEIGRLTGTPASTVKSRFAAALKRLRTRLQELGWGPEEDRA